MHGRFVCENNTFYIALNMQTWLGIGRQLCCTSDAKSSRPHRTSAVDVVTQEPMPTSPVRVQPRTGPAPPPGHIHAVLVIMPVLFAKVSKHIPIDDLRSVLGAFVAIVQLQKATFRRYNCGCCYSADTTRYDAVRENGQWWNARCYTYTERHRGYGACFVWRRNSDGDTTSCRFTGHFQHSLHVRAIRMSVTSRRSQEQTAASKFEKIECQNVHGLNYRPSI